MDQTVPTEPGAELLPRRTLDLLEAAVAIEQEDAREAGALRFMARVFCQSALPYRNPGDTVPLWRRKNGNFELLVRPAARVDKRLSDTSRGFEAVAAGDVTYRHAYGVVPRLLLVWMTTEVVRGSGRQLELGDSLGEFLGKLGMASTGGKTGTLRRVREQIQALAESQIEVHEARAAATPDGYNTETFIRAGIASRYFLAWSSRDPLGAKSLLAPSLTLTEDMHEVMQAGVPVDERALKALRTQGGGGLALDIYVWLVHRLFYLRQPTTIPWELLALQFGNQYARTIDFRRKFEQQLRTVLVVLPDRDCVRPQPAGLRLVPQRRQLSVSDPSGMVAA